MRQDCLSQRYCKVEAMREKAREGSKDARKQKPCDPGESTSEREGGPRAPSASDGFLVSVPVYAGSSQLNLLVLTSNQQTLCGEGEKSTTRSGLFPGRDQSSWPYHDDSSFR